MTSDERIRNRWQAAIADLAPDGTIKAAINVGNSVLAQRRQVTGALGGVSVDLATELGRRLNVPLELVPFESAGSVAGAARTGAWTIAFLAIDPARAVEIDYTTPYVVIEATYVVPASSQLRTIADVDRPGRSHRREQQQRLRSQLQHYVPPVRQGHPAASESPPQARVGPDLALRLVPPLRRRLPSYLRPLLGGELRRPASPPFLPISFAA